MKFEKLGIGARKNAIIGGLMLTAFFILLPTFVSIINDVMAPYSENEVVITTVSYESEGFPGGDPNIIVGELYQPSPKFGAEKYPIVIACHGFLMGFGKESMHRWCVEIAKRGFVVMSIDLPGNGMSIGEMDMFPRKDLEPQIIEDGIQFLKGYDFVDGSKVGIMGISYGGATVSMAAGVLGKKIDATISMNGFTNTTNWLIEGLLPEAGFKFSVEKDYIKLREVEGKEITKDNILEFLKLYGIFRGDDRQIEDLIISGTTKLDRKFLKKFDAVEYLKNCKNNSVLFIHSKHDGTFDKTNQSGQGWEAIENAGKNAHYILVDDNHQLMDDPEYSSDYCIINFFEEKLKGKDLGDDWDNDYEKYSQERDIELTVSRTFSFMTLYIALGSFFLSIIPAFFVFSIIIYNKKIATKRAETEDLIVEKKTQDPDFLDTSFGRGSYLKMALFLVLSYFLAYMTILGVGLGVFSEIMAGFCCAAFYLVLFLALYYLPDKAEVERWARLNPKRDPHPFKENKEEIRILDVNAYYILGGICALVVITALIGSFISPQPTIFKKPLEPIMTTLLVMGTIMLIGGIIIIWFLEKRAYEGIKFRQINWGKYDLGKYEFARSFMFGSALFLNFIFQYNIWAFYMKFPSILGPHSIYYIYAVAAIIIFYASVNLVLKIIKEAVFKDNMQLEHEGKKRIAWLAAIEFIVFALGLVFFGILAYIAFFPILNTYLFGNMTMIMVYFLCGMYLIATIVRIFSSDRGVFGVEIFIPLALFTIVAFLFHI
ncbi:MAG: alpha/beta hydrolase family protein [Promethearchaeota archaeon]